MKIKCDFCKTEYSLDYTPNAPVKCVVCGHSWTVAHAPRKNVWLTLFASICALLSAIIFTVAVITHQRASNVQTGPLVASVSSVDTRTDDAGQVQLIVNGSIKNISDDIYGVPDLLIIATDANDKVLMYQKFMPSATLLDSGASVNFSHILSSVPVGVKKISAKLVDFEQPKEEKK